MYWGVLCPMEEVFGMAFKNYQVGSFLILPRIVLVHAAFEALYQ